MPASRNQPIRSIRVDLVCLERFAYGNNVAAIRNSVSPVIYVHPAFSIYCHATTILVCGLIVFLNAIGLWILFEDSPFRFRSKCTPFYCSLLIIPSLTRFDWSVRLRRWKKAAWPTRTSCGGRMPNYPTKNILPNVAADSLKICWLQIQNKALGTGDPCYPPRDG